MKARPLERKRVFLVPHLEQGTCQPLDPTPRGQVAPWAWRPCRTFGTPWAQLKAGLGLGYPRAPHARPPLKNSYTKAIEPFIPLDPEGKLVTFYSCGPTVYSFAHIGNFRSFLLADLLRRVLERRGHEVRHVMNITDVGHMTEDHLADAERRGQARQGRARARQGSLSRSRSISSARSSRTPSALGSQSTRAPRPRTRSSTRAPPRHVPEMLAMIQTLLDRGYAYADAQGQVYFAIAKFPDYGQLSGKVHRGAGGRRARRGARGEARPARLRAVEGRRPST